jgi:nitrogen-specific signal transduction histidine kinase
VESDLDAGTVAVLAHGMLSSLTAIVMAARMLAESHPDQVLSQQLGQIIDAQADSMRDTLRMLCAGLPQEVILYLDEMTQT